MRECVCVCVCVRRSVCNWAIKVSLGVGGVPLETRGRSSGLAKSSSIWHIAAEELAEEPTNQACSLSLTLYDYTPKHTDSHSLSLTLYDYTPKHTDSLSLSLTP